MNQISLHTLHKLENIKLIQIKVAACLKADTAFANKWEKGERKSRREQVLLLAELFNVDKEELLSLWLGEKVYNVLKDKRVANEALKVAGEKINYKKKTQE